MKCSIVKDLLSNYIDGLCSEETDLEIRKHLETCDDCRAVYEKMSASIPLELSPEDKDIDFLKKLKKKMFRRNVVVAISTFIAALVGFIIFARNYEIPIPFDAYRMSVEEFKAVAVKQEDGKIRLKAIDPELIGTYIPEDSEEVIDAVQLAYKGINNIGECSRGRTINRNGEKVRVVYYCYTKTLWNSLFIDSDLMNYSESGSSYGSELYEDSYESGEYKPQMKEIYYLPIRNLEKIDELSDEEFDKLREKCDLIWHGVV